MKKRPNKPSSASHDGLFVASHLTDGALLRAIDGELSSKHAGEAQRHIQTCWSCRSRKQVLEQQIAGFVALQDSLIALFLPLSDGPRNILLARLDQAAAEMDRPPLYSRWFGNVLGVLRANQFATVAVAVFIIAVSIFWHLLKTPPTVSASEALNRACATERSELHHLREPVVVQKLRITSGTKTITRTVYLDIARNRLATQSENSGSEEASIRAAYARSSLAWDSTLDAESYRRWKNTRPSGTEHVSVPDHDHLRVATIFASGPITEAALTLRMPEYHATSEEFSFQDKTHVEITELSHDVIPFSSLAQNIFGDGVPAVGAALPDVAKIRGLSPVPASDAPSDAEIARVQLEAERDLHALGADLGEQITIAARSGQGVTVIGVVRNPERKDQVLEALKGISHLELKISTIEEAASQAAPSTTPSSGPTAASVPILMPVSPPLLEEQLNAHFPDKKQRIAYVNQTLSITQLASSRAWALKRLADRHSTRQIALLDASSRNDLKILLADHTSALREDVDILDRQLRELIDSSDRTSATSSAANTPARSIRAESGEDWRDQVRRIHSLTETVHEAVTALITNSQPVDHADSTAILADLRTDVAQLQLELKALDENLGKKL